MKNVIYAGVIGVCILLAVVVFVKTRGGGSGINDLSDSEMTWVKCLKCNQGYEMSLKQYITQVSEKSMANPSPMPVTLPLTCEKCGEVFREGAVQNDFPDRCPKCKHSATEAKREANKAARQQG